MSHTPANVPGQALRAQIEAAADVGTLRAIREVQHADWLRRLPVMDGGAWNAGLNGVHDALIRRAVAIAERKLAERGEGTPPVPYAFVLLGSGGRAEQTLGSDQDNGLIYADADPATQEKADVYFTKLAVEISESLRKLGYPPCSGGVLCDNPLWRQPVSGWLRTVREWLEQRSWGHVRYLLVIADMRPVYGESELAAEVAAELRDFVRRQRSSLEDLLANTLHRKVSLTPFGRLVKERYGEDAGGVDVKYGCYIPFVNAVRLLALLRGVPASSTLERIEALGKCGEITPGEAACWTEAFQTILKFRAQTPMQAEEGLYQSRGMLTAAQLTRTNESELKRCLKAGKKAARHVRKAVANYSGNGSSRLFVPNRQ